MPKIDIDAAPVLTGTGYPPPFDAAVKGRSRQRIGDVGGLTQYGVNLLTLAPGAASAHRHWHAKEDEFVYVLEGEVALVEDAGEYVLKKGEAAAFPAGAPNGHHLVNRANKPALLLEVGTRAGSEEVCYTDPEVDLSAVKTETGWRFLHKDGSLW